jgi:isoquinoline 1-oxidoreductase beta subunit
MSLIENVSRRQFLGTTLSTGAFVLAAQVLPKSAFAQDPGVRTRAQGAPLNPSVYLGIDTDGTIYIITHRSEMGTGIRTTLPLVAPTSSTPTGAPSASSRGSATRSTATRTPTARARFATSTTRSAAPAPPARSMLVSAAAARWKVPANEITIQNSILIHAKSNRRLAFAAVVADAAKLPVPKDADLTFKNKADWNFVGKEREIYDLRDITTGKAAFGLDTFRDGMVYASIEHPPVVGGSVKSLDDKAALAVKGVRRRSRCRRRSRRSCSSRLAAWR